MWSYFDGVVSKARLLKDYILWTSSILFWLKACTAEFVKWIFPSLKLDWSIVSFRDIRIIMLNCAGDSTRAKSNHTALQACLTVRGWQILSSTGPSTQWLKSQVWQEFMFTHINIFSVFQDPDKRPSFVQLSRTLTGLMDTGNYPHLWDNCSGRKFTELLTVVT